MIDFLMTRVKSAAQLIYILTVFGIIITSITVLFIYVSILLWLQLFKYLIL